MKQLATASQTTDHRTNYMSDAICQSSSVPQANRLGSKIMYYAPEKQGKHHLDSPATPRVRSMQGYDLTSKTPAKTPSELISPISSLATRTSQTDSPDSITGSASIRPVRRSQELGESLDGSFDRQTRMGNVMTVPRMRALRSPPMP